MVRTKADAGNRVAAGGKAPKKSLNYVRNSPSRSPIEKGKDNLPVNRYFPRETPVWQKKITFFYDRNIALSHSSKLSKNTEVSEQNVKNIYKRSSFELEEIDKEINENKLSTKKMKTSKNMEAYFKQKTNLNDSTEINENEIMEMDE